MKKARYKPTVILSSPEEKLQYQALSSELSHVSRAAQRQREQLLLRLQ